MLPLLVGFGLLALATPAFASTGASAEVFSGGLALIIGLLAWMITDSLGIGLLAGFMAGAGHPFLAIIIALLIGSIAKSRKRPE